MIYKREIEEVVVEGGEGWSAAREGRVAKAGSKGKAEAERLSTE